MNIEYEIVHECDQEDGTPTCWATKYGNQFWWIEIRPDGYYMCVTTIYGEQSDIRPCKSFGEAERWISKHHQEWTPSNFI